NQRLIPVAMEPRGVMADYKPGEKQLTVWSSTQIPHLLRTQLAVMLGVPEGSVRVITPEVGGGFGSKLNVYPEEALVGYLAMRLLQNPRCADADHRGLHQQDGHRRLSRRGAARSHLHHRARHGLGGRRAEKRSRRGASQEFSAAERISLHYAHRPHLRQRRLPEVARPGAEE